MNMQVLALAFLATAAVGGIAWVFLYPLLSGERKAESRRASIARAEAPTARQAEKTQRSRREQVESTLKDLEARRLQEKSASLTTRRVSAIISWSMSTRWPSRHRSLTIQARSTIAWAYAAIRCR